MLPYEKAVKRIGYNCPQCRAHDSVLHAAGRPTVKWTYCGGCARFLRVSVAPFGDAAKVETFDMPLGDDEQPEPTP
jgi:hypothetical protein